MELLTFPPELNYIPGIFQRYLKYNFIYIFLNATVLVKKNTPPPKTQNKQKTAPALKCQLTHKSTKHRKEPGIAMVQLQTMKLNHFTHSWNNYSHLLFHFSCSFTEISRHNYMHIFILNIKNSFAKHHFCITMHGEE